MNQEEILVKWAERIEKEYPIDQWYNRSQQLRDYIIKKKIKDVGNLPTWLCICVLEKLNVGNSAKSQIRERKDYELWAYVMSILYWYYEQERSSKVLSIFFSRTLNYIGGARGLPEQLTELQKDVIRFGIVLSYQHIQRTSPLSQDEFLHHFGDAIHDYDMIKNLLGLSQKTMEEPWCDIRPRIEAWYNSRHISQPAPEETSLML